MDLINCIISGRYDTQHMDVSKILDSVRSDYISGFVNEISNVQEQGFVALEPPKMEDSGDIITHGDLELPSRNDWLVMIEDQVNKYSFDLAVSNISFEPVHLKWNDNISISIYPFHWGQCYCHLSDNKDEDADINWHFLRQWYLKWFDEGISDIHGFSGCVHSMTDPKPVDNGFQLLIDFGSAPIEAIEDWVETAEYMGFTKASIGYAAGMAS